VPRSGETYPIDDDWRERVEARMLELDISRADLARACSCRRNVITDLLDGDQAVSTLVPLVHKALRWEPPISPLLSSDEQELIAMYRKLKNHPEHQAKVKERAVTYAELVDPKKDKPGIAAKKTEGN
jgi:hypothetical protein